MPFSQHTSPELNHWFSERPFQGQHPLHAKVIFLGYDANYPPDIEERHNCFDLLQQYLADGVRFWENRDGNNPGNKHHPFLICMK